MILPVNVSVLVCIISAWMFATCMLAYFLVIVLNSHHYVWRLGHVESMEHVGLGWNPDLSTSRMSF